MSASNESHSAVRRGVSIRAHFTLPTQEARKAASAADYILIDGDNDDADTDTTTTIIQHNLDERNCSPARLGLPEHEEPQKPQPGEYVYTGMHDHGPLPPPREGGEFARLVACANRARELSDALLTEIIDAQRQQHTAKKVKAAANDETSSSSHPPQQQQPPEPQKRQKTC
eukprot:scaffold6828_cov53-Attheya_sp.AAC.2